MSINPLNVWWREKTETEQKRGPMETSALLFDFALCDRFPAALCMGPMPSSAPYRMLCIRKMPPDRHHQDRVRRGVRRSQLHSASAEAAKAPYPLAPSSFPNCDRCAGSQFGVIWCGQMHRGTELLHDGGTGRSPGFESSLSFLHRARRFFSFSIKRKKRMGAQSGRTGSSAPTQ